MFGTVDRLLKAIPAQSPELHLADGFSVTEIVLIRGKTEDFAGIEETGDDAAAIAENLGNADKPDHDLEDVRCRIAVPADGLATSERFERLLTEEPKQPGFRAPFATMGNGEGKLDAAFTMSIALSSASI